MSKTASGLKPGAPVRISTGCLPTIKAYLRGRAARSVLSSLLGIQVRVFVPAASITVV
jgi:hypothetical protein